jgi:hypothetical protein
MHFKPFSPNPPIHISIISIKPLQDEGELTDP